MDDNPIKKMVKVKNNFMCISVVYGEVPAAFKLLCVFTKPGYSQVQTMIIRHAVTVSLGINKIRLTVDLVFSGRESHCIPGIENE